MQTDIQEIYAATIRPLTDEQKLRIATLILEEVTGKSSTNGVRQATKRKGDITKFFGMWKGGGADDSDNDKLDADLARAYVQEAKEEN